MSGHDDLLKEGAREAPEPETAEQRSRRTGLTKTAGGGLAAGGIGLAKAGVLGKFFLWWFAWNGAIDAWRVGGWIAVALVAVAIAAYLVYHRRRQQAA
jgi:hypothetical protein